MVLVIIMKKFFISVPHSGEIVPPECDWIESLEEKVRLQDADRFVDVLYRPVAEKLNIEFHVAQYLRYVVDLNRDAGDIEALSVVGCDKDIGKFHKKGLHWVETTRGEPILKKPHSLDFHKELVEKYYWPWHNELQSIYDRNSNGDRVFQLDCHSMPSVGTGAHADSGKLRPEVVVSDFLGKSCDSDYLDLVMNTFKDHFSDVSYNSPYIGGGITAKYGQPSKNQNCIQIELRRDMYMDEETKLLHPENSKALSQKLELVIESIYKSEILN